MLSMLLFWNQHPLFFTGLCPMTSWFSRCICLASRYIDRSGIDFFELELPTTSSLATSNSSSLSSSWFLFPKACPPCTSSKAVECDLIWPFQSPLMISCSEDETSNGGLKCIIELIFYAFTKVSLRCINTQKQTQLIQPPFE